MTRILVLDIAAPCAFLNSNDRLHWRKKAPLTALWREAGRLSVPDHIKPFTGRVRVTATIHKPRNNRYDAGNFYPTAKAACDGALVDSGLLPDDSNEYLIGPDMRAGATSEPRLILRIEDNP